MYWWSENGIQWNEVQIFVTSSSRVSFIVNSSWLGTWHHIFLPFFDIELSHHFLFHFWCGSNLKNSLFSWVAWDCSNYSLIFAHGNWVYDIELWSFQFKIKICLEKLILTYFVTKISSLIINLFCDWNIILFDMFCWGFFSPWNKKKYMIIAD